MRHRNRVHPFQPNAIRATPCVYSRYRSHGIRSTWTIDPSRARDTRIAKGRRSGETRRETEREARRNPRGNVAKYIKVSSGLFRLQKLTRARFVRGSGGSGFDGKNSDGTSRNPGPRGPRARLVPNGVNVFADGGLAPSRWRLRRVEKDNGIGRNAAR